jgi:hypothetical protein
VLPFQEFLTPPPPTPTLPADPASLAAPLATPAPTALPTLPAPTPLPGTPAPTPAPGTPVTLPSAPATADASTTANLAAVVALLIYLGFFGVLGYRRGSQRELILLSVLALTAFGLRIFTEQIVTLFDRIGKGVAFATGQPIPEQSALGVWAQANTTTLILIIWLIVLVLAYWFTNRFVRKTKKDGWAFLLGLLNGLIIASIFAPLLTSLIYPGASLEGTAVQFPVFEFLGNVWEQMTSLLSQVWTAIGPISTSVFFLGIVLLILFAAFTLRTSVKPKS